MKWNGLSRLGSILILQAGFLVLRLRFFEVGINWIERRLLLLVGVAGEFR